MEAKRKFWWYLMATGLFLVFIVRKVGVDPLLGLNMVVRCFFALYFLASAIYYWWEGWGKWNHCHNCGRTENKLVGYTEFDHGMVILKWCTTCIPKYEVEEDLTTHLIEIS